MVPHRTQKAKSEEATERCASEEFEQVMEAFRRRPLLLADAISLLLSYLPGALTP